ncbi:MAG: transglycosylase domain-containing protein [Streptosporangiaceae bacterium]|nr:transglycosylase domain-containing protein [Streptosporangiaceae bacterium]MBV9858109.1 transglycosylase domain-containing protein [Streptosporangiaceae bacterium]
MASRGLLSRIRRTAPDATPKRRSLRRRVALWALKAVAAVAALVIAAFGVLLVITPSAGQATAIARARARAERIAYPGPPVPANFARPLTATEDHRFYTEPGIDPFAVVRVVVGSALGHHDLGGAGLEQQLAKMLYTPHGTGWTAELEQVALALKLNFTYSKGQILSLYAEVAYYGHGYYGLQAASCGYFGHPPSELTVVQGAMLAGVVNAPSVDDPIVHPALARARLAHVLDRMVAVGDLSQAQAAPLLSAPLRLAAVPGCRP